jgi:hypothetical protein
MNENMVAEVRKRWNRFVDAFHALGAETRGMTPAAASVLLVAAAEFASDNSKGYQPLLAGVPRFAAFSVNRIVDIRCDYFGCPEFWDVDINYQRAKITQAGVDYVNLHFDVFNILFEGS